MRGGCAVEGDVRLEDWMGISRKRRLGVDAARRSGVAVVMRGVWEGSGCCGTSHVAN